MKDMREYIASLPKAELHLHIEGTLEPEMLFELAKRNQIPLRFSSPEELKRAYQFTNLQSFLDIYYEGVRVLQTEEDFYDLTLAYAKKAASQNVTHAEIFFDPQSHTDRNIPFLTVITGIHRAMLDAKKKWNLSGNIILCFLRHLSADSAMKTLEEALPFKKWIVAVGLDSSEKGHPPSKFKKVFERAQKEGFLTVAHAGEEGPPSNIVDSIEMLGVSRIDHGVRCLEDPAVVELLRRKQIPLTVCPLSNIKLKVFSEMKKHNLKKLLQEGLVVTLNSDDPAYFGGYIQENYEAAAKALGLSENEIKILADNSFKASFKPII